MKERTITPQTSSPRASTARFGALVLALALAAAGCVFVPGPEAGPLAPGPDARWVEKTMRSMTLEEKVGQLIACRFTGDFRNSDSDSIHNLERLVVGNGVGGLILFGGAGVYETAFLINHFQRMARVPLLIAADFEHGAGTKTARATNFPPLMALGAAGSEDLAYEMGRITAEEGRALGVHMTYAPVVDVNVNPANPIINTRSIGEDPGLVSRIALAFIRGCQEHGMIATAKHFPGHGDTELDSHLLLPTIAGDRERLDRVELRPFAEAVEGGVEAVMVAHLHVPALDPTPGLPSSLSAPIVTGVLRGELGFEGLIVTDAMEMGGITRAFGDEEAALMAVLAGNDMVLLPLDTPKAIAHIVEAVREGRITEARIDESVRRILEAKSRLGLQRNKIVNVNALDREIARREHLGQAAKTFEAAATLVKNDGPVLPLGGETKKVAVFSLSSDPGDYFAGRTFVAEMRKRRPDILSFYADGDTGQETLDAACAESAGAGVAVFALFSQLRDSKGSVDLEPRHVALINKIAEAENGPAVVVLSFGSPYFLRHFPEVEAYLCLYRNSPETQEIGARAVFGEMDVGGKLPVSFPGLYPVGHGLVLKKTERR
jgi:beta-N-acetylhexosaminidase